MQEFKLKSNVDLEARMNVPKGANKAMIIAHSLRNDFNFPVCREAEEKFAVEGIATLAFNFLGHGKSGGELKDVNYAATAENISSAITYLKDKRFWKVGVYGIGLGAVAAILSEEKPDAQVLISPRLLYNPKVLLDDDGYGEDINKQRAQMDEKGFVVITSSSRGEFSLGAEWIHEMEQDDGKMHRTYNESNVSTLIVQGSEDELIQRKPTVNFLAQLPSKSDYKVMEGDSNFTAPEQRKVAISTAIEWVQNKFAPRPAPDSTS